MANAVGQGKMKFIGSNDSLGNGSPAEINPQLDMSWESNMSTDVNSKWSQQVITALFSVVFFGYPEQLWTLCVMTNRCSGTGIWPLVSALKWGCWLLYSLKPKCRKLRAVLSYMEGWLLSVIWVLTFIKSESHSTSLDAVVSDIWTQMGLKKAEQPKFSVPSSFPHP